MEQLQNNKIENQYNGYGTSPESIETPEFLQNNYRYIKRIGRGSQAHVFLAERLTDHAKVAIKEVQIESVQNWREYELFKRESNTLATLNVAGTAKFYDGLEDLYSERPAAYIVQEYIPGNTLQDLLNAGHRFTQENIYHIALQLIDILDQLHHHNPPVIHRDIKPSNIIVSDDQKYKVTLIDFGAVANPQVQSGGSTIAGTYGYMAPEQLMGHPNEASDLYSFAATLVYLLGGVSPTDMDVQDFRLVFEPYLESAPHAVVTLLRAMLDPISANRLTDYKKIRTQFKNFKNNTYRSDTAASSNKPADENLEKALLSHLHINQLGNMAIWQNLSESTPRPIPESFVSSLVQTKKTPFFLKKYKYRNEGGLSPSTVLYFTIIYFVIASVLLANAVIQSGMTDVIITIILIAAAIGVIIFITLLRKTKIIAEERDPFSEEFEIDDDVIQWRIYNNENAFKHNNDANFRQYIGALIDLIQNGRKSIATICDIEYVPMQNMLIEHSNEDRLNYYHGEACFRIRYKFNPPDDRNDNDLIHEFTTSTEPEDHYKVGDHIPILYQIVVKHHANAKKDQYVVHSIPFPCDIDDLKNQSLMSTSVLDSNS